MDEKLQAQIAEAKANGYSDDDIQQYLIAQTQSQAPAQEPAPGRRDEEHVGTMQAAAIPAGEMAIKAAEIGGVGYGLKKLAIDPIRQAIQQAGPNARTVMPNGDVFRGGQPGFNNASQGIRPVAPTSGFDAGGQKVADFVQQRGQFAPQAAAPSAEAQAYQAQQAARAAAQSPTAPPTAQNFLQRMMAMAGEYAPAARVATGAGLGLYSSGLNQGEDEQIRQMRAKQDEARRLGLIR